jgi:hypothetical protein
VGDTVIKWTNRQTDGRMDGLTARYHFSQRAFTVILRSSHRVPYIFTSF